MRKRARDSIPRPSSRSQPSSNTSPKYADTPTSQRKSVNSFRSTRRTAAAKQRSSSSPANLRVSVSIAAEYLHTGADHMDLIQEGNVGLMHAIKKFDPSKNVRFYAYAAWWSRAYILRLSAAHLPTRQVGTTQDQRKLFYNLKKEKAKLEREGFAPDTKLLADRLNVRERDVVEMDQRLGNWELSLDQPIGEGSGKHPAGSCRPIKSRPMNNLPIISSKRSFVPSWLNLSKHWKSGTRIF
ncbi:MAG: sigma-70 family RNA polymerase sigma factor [Nitrospira sp.]|nr:sigma-70 family RNA polymerase sigma factor [Nitrospira sp.]